MPGGSSLGACCCFTRPAPAAVPLTPVRQGPLAPQPRFLTASSNADDKASSSDRRSGASESTSEGPHTPQDCEQEKRDGEREGERDASGGQQHTSEKQFNDCG
ncbi:hypothetical protein Vretimale_17815 [Volvox reticuliferus]|uniref:Uncharacterized protein n=1 Tax=Volvox reticuliferus TaxID=1737510 RepID=A0A8J4GX78_9CHLO|nr:hypothetical protein Vretimale_17815 [Volvox reticuliferus]